MIWPRGQVGLVVGQVTRPPGQVPQLPGQSSTILSMTIPRRPPLVDILCWGLVAVLAVFAAKRIVHQSWELLAGTGYAAAFDLRLRYVETTRWIAGEEVYATTQSSNYPPATYAFLGPLIGHLEWPAVRLLWLVGSLAALGALSWMAVRAVDGRPGTRALAAVLPWAVYGSALTLGVGQFGLICMAAGLGGVLLARRAGGNPAGASGAALLFTLSLAKPTLTAPWFWLLLLASPVAAGLAVVLYGAATLVAAAFQPEPLPRLLSGWIDNGHLHAARGYGNLADWATALGFGGWIVSLSLAMLGGLLVWVVRHRRADLWILLGVSAFVARFFTYHYYVDDLLILVPMIALLRLATRDSDQPVHRRAAAAAFLLAALAQLTPTRFFTELGPGMTQATESFQTLVWLAAAGVLVWAAPAFPSYSAPPSSPSPFFIRPFRRLSAKARSLGARE
jgi:hypothetical protein